MKKKDGEEGKKKGGARYVAMLSKKGLGRPRRSRERETVGAVGGPRGVW